MFLFCVSLPGRFGDWCDAVIGRLAQATIGPVVSTGSNTAEELAVELIRSTGDHFYVGARHPGRWLREMLVAHQKNFVAALDDPRHVASDWIVRHNLSLAEVSRLIASSCASMCRFASLPGALVVSYEDAKRNQAATVEAIARHLDLPVGRSEIAKIIADLDAGGLGLGEESEMRAAEPLPDRSIATIEGALASYAALFDGGRLTPIVWSRELFLEENHQPATHPLNLAGEIRYLIYGPYISLPPGSWVAEIVLGFSDDAIDTSFRVEAWAGSLLGTIHIEASAPGLARVNINFALDESNDGLVEIRVVNERPASQGRLMLGQTTLSLVHDLSSAVVDTLTAELGLPPDPHGWSSTAI